MCDFVSRTMSPAKFTLNWSGMHSAVTQVTFWVTFWVWLGTVYYLGVQNIMKTRVCNIQ